MRRVPQINEVVTVDKRGDEHDRAVGRVTGTRLYGAGDDGFTGVADVAIATVGVRRFDLDNLVPFGIGVTDQRAVPEVGNMVELLVTFEDLGIDRGQLARVVEVGPIPHRPDVAGFRLKATNRAGTVVRGWVTADQIHRLP